ncbi:tetraspanin-3 [Strongylocentrotus purpuratus]|uniref:H15 domain-containing protein n=1 Tax=Strongylocentrotus purpuratus TaxID=7668 RepID=A0A7M7T2Z9_STRPU|nr:tetraspanin-3 [Strongylocentrotus purpuratus]
MVATAITELKDRNGSSLQAIKKYIATNLHLRVAFVCGSGAILCGLVLIGVGAYVTVNYNDYQDLFADDTMLTVSWTAISIGLFIFVVGFSGCCGTLKESSCLLKLIANNMTKGMQKAINETYGVKDGTTKAVDDVQDTFECCGASWYKDYKTSQHLQPGFAVPPSCCRHGEECTGGSKGNPDYPNRVWTDVS